MPNAFQIEISGIKEVEKQLKALAPAVLPACEMAIANYLLLQLTTKEVPPYKRVTRRSVYGKPFQSARQRRWFFWALKHSVIDVPYRRRGKHGGISTQWVILQRGKGVDTVVTLQNDDPAAQYVYGDGTQNKLIGRIGWKTIGQITASKVKNLGGVIKRAADKAIKDALRKSK